MLRIHTITSASRAKNYYASADYYSQGQETVGRWGGKLAERFGLCGTVDQQSFDRLCDNLHPTTGRALTPRTNRDRRIGYDFTFSVPKSVSAVEALADEAERARLLLAFDEAVSETMTEQIEPDLHTRVRVGGAREDRRAGTMIWASFDHSTSRPVDGSPPDPHRHRHVVVFNATHDPVEDRIKAGEFANIKRHGEFYTAVFYAKLASKLEGLGYSIDRKGGKQWEIAGVPQRVIDQFSKRTEEVEAEHQARLLNDPDYRPENRHELGAKTRSKKQKELTEGELRDAWFAQLQDGDREALAAVHGKRVAKTPAVTPSQALAFAIEHLGEQQSVWTERELQRVALLHGLGHVSLDKINAELGRQDVIVRDFEGTRMATTKALQREENFLAGFAAQGRGTVVPAGVPEGLERGKLNQGQWDVVLGLLNSPNRVELVEGPAGSGKSWSLKKFDEALRKQGETVTYLGTTTDSVEVLQKEGFNANTVALFLLDERLQTAARGSRVVVDETSLLGHKDAYRLFQVAQAKDLKLIFVGDAMQHGSVSRGATMRVLKDYGGVKPFRLTEIKRQEDAEYVAAVTKLAEGKPAEGFDSLERKEWDKEIVDDDKRYRAMASEYAQAIADKKTILVVSPTHREADRITQEIRSKLREAGKLGREEKTFTRLVAVNASEAERKLTTTYRAGDVIQFHNHAKGGFKKGQRLTVADPSTIPVSEASKFSLYRPEAITLAVGDKIRGTGTVMSVDGKHKFRNGSTATVAGFTAKGIKLDNGWVLPADAGHYRFGYVETSFGSQGRTVQRAIIGMSSNSLGATNREQIYVSSSRAREKLTLYTDDKEGVRRGIVKSSQKLAALDLRPAPPQPKPKRRPTWRKHLDRLRRLAALNRIRAAWDAPAPPIQREVQRGR